VSYKIDVKAHVCLINAMSEIDGSSGRQTVWATDEWTTNQPGDSQLGDTFWSTGRQK